MRAAIFVWTAGLILLFLVISEIQQVYQPPFQALQKDMVQSATSPSEHTSAVSNQKIGKSWRSFRTFQLIAPLSSPLRVYVETQPSDASLYKPAYHQYVKEALAAWSNALEGRLNYVLVDNPKDAQIQVAWVRRFPDPYTAGEAVYKVGHAKIYIKTVGVPAADIRTNVMHEFGHSLGIAEHSPNASDVMVAMRRWSTMQPKLSANDVAAIRRLYSYEWVQGEDLYQAIARSAMR